jgi:hypothetical protein
VITHFHLSLVIFHSCSLMIFQPKRQRSTRSALQSGFPIAQG